MNTLIVGGGQGCRALLDLTRGDFLRELRLSVIAVVDVNPYAPGMIYANDIGLETYTGIQQALDRHDIQIVVELTGSDSTLKQLQKILPPEINIIDHTVARLFWDIVNARVEKEQQLIEMKKLDHELQKERHFLQSIFDSLTEMALVIDRDKSILRVNKRLAKYLNKSPEDLIGKKREDVMAEFNKQYSVEDEIIINEVIKTGESQSIIHISDQPVEKHWEITRSALKDQSGQVMYVLETWHPITEKVMLHREMLSVEQRFRSFINSAQDWISMKDLNGKYTIVNPVTAGAFHLRMEDFIGKTPEEVFPSGLAQTINKHDDEVIRTMEAHTYEEVIPIDGQDHVFQTVRFPLTDYRNEMIGVCTIARDITKELTLQEQLVQSEKLAAIGKLAAGVAHEINNPLTGILAFAEDLKDELKDDDFAVEDLNVIIRETLRCRDIVRHLLDFSRQNTPVFQKATPFDIINNTLGLINKLPQFRNIEIFTDLNRDNIELAVDPKQIQQVLLNFLLNAAEEMKFMGKLYVKSGLTEKGNSIFISVEDTGPGVPDHIRERIFEPFFSTKGTNGIGLAVSWGIINRHRGRIEVENTSIGAKFTVYLPLTRTADLTKGDTL